jgi:hypothetical protein
LVTGRDPRNAVADLVTAGAHPALRGDRGGGPGRRGGDPKTTDPKATDPKTGDPKTGDPKATDPRAPEPKPEQDET